MNEQLKDDLENIENLLDRVKIQGLDFLNQLSERPTSSKLIVKPSEKLNDIGIGGLNAINNLMIGLSKL